MIFDQLNDEKWEYLNEGNKNCLFSYKGENENYVLFEIKYQKNKVLRISKEPEDLEDYYENNEFLNRFIKPVIGPDFISDNV